MLVSVDSTSLSEHSPLCLYSVLWGLSMSEIEDSAPLPPAKSVTSKLWRNEKYFWLLKGPETTVWDIVK